MEASHDEEAIAEVNKQAARALAQLDSLAKRDLTIIRLSEPISSAVEQCDNNSSNAATARTSDISTSSSLDALTTTPASLEADLEHYRELFAKLRFSYVEQVTKEKFIRAVIGVPPLIVDPAENADLEALNTESKAALRALKHEVAALVADLRRRGIDLARRRARTEEERLLLREASRRTLELAESVAALRARVVAAAEEENSDRDPEMRLPLARTASLAEGRKADARALGRLLEGLRAAAARKRREADRARAELAPLETKRANSTAAAGEAKRRKEAALGGVEDNLEERGRWERSSEALLLQAIGG